MDQIQQQKPILKANIDSFKLFEIIKNLNNFVNDIFLRFDINGLKIIEMDPATVLYIETDINKKAFNKYSCDSDINIDINCNDLFKILKDSDPKKTTLNLSLNNKDSDCLNLSFSDGFKSDIFIIDGSETNIISKRLNTLDFNNDSVNINIDPKPIKQFIKRSAKIGESIKFKSYTLNDIKHLKLISENDLKNNLNIDLFNNSDYYINTFCDSDAKYSNEYLKKIFQYCLNTESVNILFKSDYPIKINFSVDNINLSYVLAPRVGDF